MGKERRPNTISISPDGGSSKNHEVIAGRIYWLAEKDDHDEELLKSTSIEDGCFGHPVVVLWASKTRKIAVVYIVTSLGGQLITGYRDRQYYLAIHPAENPANSTKLFLEDQLVLDKKSYVTIVTHLTLSWKLLRPYLHYQSGKQYRLKADSQVALLSNAHGTLRATIEALDSPSSSHSLTPLSDTAVRNYETDIQRRAGLILSSRQEAQLSTSHLSIRPQSATYCAWDTNSSSPFISDWPKTQQVRQSLRGDSPLLRSSYHERSALLPSSNQQPEEQTDSEPVKTDSSWYTEPPYILALLGVVAIGYFSFFRE